MARLPRENGVVVSPQLRAIRLALKWKGGAESRNPLVRMYVKLMESNPREVAQQLERLEKEHRLAMAKAAPAGPSAEKVPSPSASGPDYETGDGYDRRADNVTPQLLGMIDRWLAGCKKRAEEGLPGSVPVEEPDDE